MCSGNGRIGHSVNHRHRFPGSKWIEHETRADHGFSRPEFVLEVEAMDQISSLASLLRCPHSNQALTVGSEEVTRLVQEKTKGNEEVDSFEVLLVSEDGRWAYPVSEGIPLVMKDKAIDLGSE